MLYVFTSCALNFVPCAKLLAESVRLHMPDARFVLTLSDDRPEDFDLRYEGFDEVLFLEDFADDLENPRGWAFGHEVMELATALKPFTAAKLLAREDCDAVMFFDPDCVLFGDMRAMRDALHTHSVLLTPHASLMHENERWLFFERNPLKVGTFNLGFLGLKNSDTGRAVASWWRFRLREHCLIDPANGLFTDQKWMDLIPSYTDDYRVMRDPTYNIARWNTFQRRVASASDGSWIVDGQPVQFIHFSGFYKVGPYVKGLYDGHSERLIDDLEPLRALSMWYSGELDRVRTRPEYAAPWRLGTYSNGQAIPREDRARYRRDADLRARFPDPYGTSRLDSFWLYCRRVERVEAETQRRMADPISQKVDRVTKAHNTMLRKLNDAFSLQIVEAERQLAMGRSAEVRGPDVGDRLLQDLYARLREVPATRIAASRQILLEHASFDAQAYLAANEDVARIDMDPFVHFIRYGLAEGREAQGFDGRAFLERNIDRLLQLVSPDKSASLSQGARSVARTLFGPHRKGA